MGMRVTRFDVWLVNLGPAVGSEIQETRPCVIVSPDEIHRHLGTAIVAPLTTAGKPYPSRVACMFQGGEGKVVLDQLRTVDQVHMVRQVGVLDRATAHAVLAMLQGLFAC